MLIGTLTKFIYFYYFVILLTAKILTILRIVHLPHSWLLSVHDMSVDPKLFIRFTTHYKM